MQTTQQSKIINLQEMLKETYGDCVLHILSGQAMYEVFAQKDLMKQGVFIPFNEAMCAGQTDEDVFSDSFIRTRANSHDVTLEEYQKVTVDPLDPLFNDSFRCMTLWFGADMFCQMNVLTILAYVGSQGNAEVVKLHLVDEYTYDVEEINLPTARYDNVYQQVLVDHQFPTEEVVAPVATGIELFLKYQQPENEITQFIEENKHFSQERLLEKLFQKFPHYGLGDVQYLAMMEAIDKK